MIHRTAGEGGGYLFNSGQQGKEEGISLTPLYHFHPLHKHLEITWAIIAESSPLHIASSQNRTGNLWFPTTKLRTLWSSRSLLLAKNMFFEKQKFDLKQLKTNKFIFDVKQLKMNKFINTIWQLIISTSNATLEVPSLHPWTMGLT